MICHMTSKNHVIEGSNDFISWSSSLDVPTLTSCVAIGVVVTSLVCHVINKDQVIKGSGDYNDRKPIRKVPKLTSLVAIGTIAVEM